LHPLGSGPENITFLPFFEKIFMHENFFVRSKNVRLERCLLRGRMELVVGTPFSVNRGRKRDAPSLDFFGANVKTLLLRTRGAMEACAHTTVDASFAVLADLDAFGDVTTLDEVAQKCWEEKIHSLGRF
jgi:hypothetical protein